MHQTPATRLHKRSFLGICLLGFALFGSACLSHVKLPNAPRFPSTVAGAGGSNAGTQSLLRSRVKQLAPQLWREFAAFWGLRKVKGRIYLRLKFLRKKLYKCDFARVDLKAHAIPHKTQRKHEKVLRQNLFDVHRFKKKGRGVCGMLMKMTWPEAKSLTPIRVDLILSK